MTGRQAVADALQSWFGQTEQFEVVDAGMGEVAGRLHLSWRIRIRPAPFGIGDGWHVIEQQAYADAAELIATIDVLCSGFRAETLPAHGSRGMKAFLAVPNRAVAAYRGDPFPRLRVPSWQQRPAVMIQLAEIRAPGTGAVVGRARPTA